MIVENNLNSETKHLGDKFFVTKTKEDYDNLLDLLFEQEGPFVLQAVFSGTAFNGSFWTKMSSVRLDSFSYADRTLKIDDEVFVHWHGTITIYWRKFNTAEPKIVMVVR